VIDGPYSRSNPNFDSSYKFIKQHMRTDDDEIEELCRVDGIIPDMECLKARE